MAIDQIEATTVSLSGAISPVNLDPGGPRSVFLSPTQNIVVNVPLASTGMLIKVAHQQDGVGGRTIAWTGVGGCAVVFPGAATGAPATLANQFSLFTLFWIRENLCLISKVIA